jgi:hypothetical protein
MIARLSGYVVAGHGWLVTQYFVAYLLFLIGACISGMLINYETFYLGRNYGRALFMVRKCVRACVCACHVDLALTNPTHTIPQIAAVQSVALLTENVYDE